MDFYSVASSRPFTHGQISQFVHDYQNSGMCNINISFFRSANSDRPRSGFFRSYPGNYIRDCALRNVLSRCRIDGCHTARNCNPVSEPTLLFQWDAICGPNEKDGDYPVFLSRIAGYGENMFVQIDTTAPAPRKKSKRRSTKREEMLVDQRRPPSEINIKKVPKRGLDDSGNR